jgi:hypothetical protein
MLQWEEQMNIFQMVNVEKHGAMQIRELQILSGIQKQSGNLLGISKIMGQL